MQRLPLNHVACILFYVVKEVIGNQWLVWDLTTRRQKIVQQKSTHWIIYAVSARSYWLHFNLIQWRGISSTQTSPTMSCFPFFSWTLYRSLPPNQLLTSLVPFSLAHRRRRTHTYTHAGSQSSCDCNNERAVTSDQCLCCSLAWWSAEWTGATASDWLSLDMEEGWGLGANSFWKVEELWRRPSCSLL